MGRGSHLQVDGTVQPKLTWLPSCLKVLPEEIQILTLWSEYSHESLKQNEFSDKPFSGTFEIIPKAPQNMMFLGYPNFV